MKITIPKLRRIIRETIEDYQQEFDGDYSKDISLLYTMRYANDRPGTAGFVEKNRIYMLELKDGAQLTPEMLVDFWYEDNRYQDAKLKKFVPIKAEVLSTESGKQRQRTGEVYDLENALEARR